MKSLQLNPIKDCKKIRLKKQNYYCLKFPLKKFVDFTGTKISNHSQRENLISYFYQLQKLDPIIKIFSNKSFRSHVYFPYVECENRLGNSWTIEIMVAEELFWFPYPFQLPELFLHFVNKNDLRLKIQFIKTLTVHNSKKKLDLHEFFDLINVRNNQLVKIKKNILRLLNTLVENKIIRDDIEIVFKSGKKKDLLIQNLTISDITRRIHYVKLHEVLKINKI